MTAVVLLSDVTFPHCHPTVLPRKSSPGHVCVWWEGGISQLSWSRDTPQLRPGTTPKLGDICGFMPGKERCLPLLTCAPRAGWGGFLTHVTKPVQGGENELTPQPLRVSFRWRGLWSSSGSFPPKAWAFGPLIYLFFYLFYCYFPQHTFFSPTVQRGDPVTHTCVHNFFSHCRSLL